MGKGSDTVVLIDALDGGRHIRVVSPRGQIEIVLEGDELVGVGNHIDVGHLLQGLGIELHQVGVVGVITVPGVADVDVALATGDAFEVGAYHGRLRRDTEREGVDAGDFSGVGRDIDGLAIGAELAWSGDADGRESLESLGIDYLDAVLFLRGDVHLRSADDSVVRRTTEGASVGSLEGITLDAVGGIVEVVERAIHLTVVAALVEDEQAVGNGHLMILGLGFFIVVIAGGEDKGACEETGEKFHVLFHFVCYFKN